jgi:hypothetical protein
LLTASSALALDIYFDQLTGLAGGALGIVAGPPGGLIGGLLGREIGRKIHPRPRPIDLTDLESRPRVTPIHAGRVIEPGEGVEDRTVDSTPVRMIEPRPAEMDARTYLASAPRQASPTRTYRISGRHRVSRAETYLVSAPSAESPADGATRADRAARAVPVSAPAAEDPDAPPGTLDYQLNQMNARHVTGEPVVQKVADLH